VTTPVRFEDEADEEYREAGRWYEARQVGLGIDFFDAVDSTIRRALDFPRAGERLHRVSTDLPVRRLPVARFPFHVIYLEPTDELCVLAIAHDHRRPGYWSSRL
jgi:plasmid stabilization system protein ParE